MHAPLSCHGVVFFRVFAYLKGFVLSERESEGPCHYWHGHAETGVPPLMAFTQAAFALEHMLHSISRRCVMYAGQWERVLRPACWERRIKNVKLRTFYSERLIRNVL